MNTLAARLSLRRERELFPGVIACAVVAIASTFLADHYGAPVMLFALLLGCAMNFLAADLACAPGIAFSARTLLRVGVALLGLRITAGQIVALGWQPLVIVLICVVTTIGLSMLVARWLGYRSTFGMLTGGATAICGASAALALSATLPPSPQRDKATSFTVIGVSTLSTVAMILYPLIARALDLDSQHAGVFLGATIHDVAQVVGAGFSMSKETGETATVVKLMRVSMLLPVIVFAVFATRSRFEGQAAKPPLLPWFAVAFGLLVLVNSTGWIPKAVGQAGSDLSRWLLVASIAAIGMKTQLRELCSVGLRPVLLMLGETVYLASLALLLLHVLGH